VRIIGIIALPRLQLLPRNISGEADFKSPRTNGSDIIPMTHVHAILDVLNHRRQHLQLPAAL
jgi:hypothetical protein